jgi:hypothetical protein
MDKISPSNSTPQFNAEHAEHTAEVEVEIEELPAFELALMQMCGDSGNW